MKKLAFIFILLFPTLGMALTPEYRGRFVDEINLLLYRHPHIIYRWGATDVYNKNQGDCSGTLYAIAHHIGWPVLRTTAVEMEAGHGGWFGRRINLDVANECDFIWWTWKDRPDRPHGHIGVLIVSPKSKLLEVAHNNKRKGLHIEPLQGALKRDMSSLKELTIGERR